MPKLPNWQNEKIGGGGGGWGKGDTGKYPFRQNLEVFKNLGLMVFVTITILTEDFPLNTWSSADGLTLV